MTTNFGNHYRYVPSPHRVSSELKPVQLEEQQVTQEIQIFGGSEVSHSSIASTGQGQLPGESATMETKLHYTNLDTNYLPSDHYSATYIPTPGNSGIGKEYMFTSEDTLKEFYCWGNFTFCTFLQTKF